jgi:transcriptional regulator GlxA family with amidase domain
MKTAILLFDNFTALDVIGPYEVLAKMPGAEICFAAQEKREYTDSYGLKISAGYALNEIQQTDILLIPGGFGVDALLKQEEVLQWVREADAKSKWTVSVCSGSLLLAHAGLLNGKNCTTHWNRKEQLKQYYVCVKNERYIQDGKYITSAGVSAGIDMAFYLVSKIAGEQSAKTIQLAIEYDPAPPFDCGSPEKAPADILARFKK